MKVGSRIFSFLNFVVNALRTGLIRPSIENPPFDGKFTRPPFLNFFEPPLTLTFFG